MSFILPVTASYHTYSIFVAENFLDDFLFEFHTLLRNRKVAVICDEYVQGLYLETLLSYFPVPPTVVISLPAKETTKSFKNVEKIITQLIEHGFRRDSLLIAFGGGVIGDLTGFCAACYYRGIDYVQIPTTLLAQVDAAVGGKTAINHPLGKNLIGAFHQPCAVFMSTKMLSSLPSRHFLAGLAEVIKYGIIRDVSFFTWLEANAEHILAKDQSCLMEIILTSCKIKAQIVAEDEYETKNFRQQLNFGHTFAHAIETCLDYEYLHGEAVAIGIVVASYLSCQLGFITVETYQMIRYLLQSFGLPIKWPSAVSADMAYQVMQRDKKNVSTGVTFVLLKQLGMTEIVSNVSMAMVKAAITACKANSELQREPLSRYQTCTLLDLAVG